MNYDDAVGKVLGGGESDVPLRASLRQAVEVNPDEEAQARAVAQRTGVPVQTVLQMPQQMRQKDQFNAATAAVAGAPSTAAFLRDYENAKIAHDDVGTLTAMEQAIRTLKSAPAALLSGAPMMSSGFYGAIAAPFEAIGQGFGAMESGVARAMGVKGWAGANAAKDIGGTLLEIARDQSALKDRIYTPPKDAGIVERGIGSGLQSSFQSLLSMPLALGGAVNTALGFMGATTGGQSYLKARDKGQSPAQAIPYAIEDAAAEVVTEKFLGFGGLMQQIKAGSSAGKLFAYELLKEVPGEMAATAWQNFNEWANVNPDKSLRDFVSEQPAALAETIVATLVGGATQIGAVKGAERVMGRIGDGLAKAQQAEQAAAQVETLQKLGAASKLMARDAGTAQTFINQVAEEGAAPTELYVDGAELANALNQSGMTSAEFEALAPVAAGQMHNADTGGDVRIPVAEFLATGDKLAGIIDHVRTDPGGMSRAEATAYYKDHGQQIEQDLERELQKVQDQTAYRDSIAATQKQFEAEIAATGRFRPEVNRAYATLLANFYGTQAARAGMTLDEFAKTYRLGVRAQVVAGPRGLSQDSNAPYHRYTDGDADTGIGYMMFAEDQSRVERSYGPNHYTFDPANLPEDKVVYAGSRAFVKLVRQALERHTDVLDEYNASAEALAAEVNPSNIVDSAEIWDAPPLVEIIRSEVLEPNGWIAVETDDGAIVFDRSAVSGATDGSLNQDAAAPAGKPGREGVSPAPAAAAPQTDGTFDPADPNILHQSSARAVHQITDDSDESPMAVVPAYTALFHGTAGPMRVVSQHDRLYLTTQRAEAGVYARGEIPGTSRGAKGASRVEEFYPDGDSTVHSIEDEIMDAIMDGDVDETVDAELKKARAAGNVDFLVYSHPSGFRNGTMQVYVPVYPDALLVKGGLYQGGKAPRAQLSFADDITASPSVISLLEGADLSSFIHEAGHFFLEVQADLAARIQSRASTGDAITAGEQGIVDDMDRLLKWFGIAGSPELSPLDTWAMMTLDEKRAHHEQFAVGFEKFAMEGKAPTLELQGVFQRFRSWLMQVYQTLRNLNVTLTDDVRAVMGRMIASDQAIEEAEAQRNMGPMVKSMEDAQALGWSNEQYDAYQALGQQPTQDAIDELQARGMQDMRWLSRARDKALKARQKEVEEQRKELMREVRAEVMSEPVYRAWQFLTGKGDAIDTGAADAKRRSSLVDPANDSLLVAIAKLGGINRDSAKRDAGVNEDYHKAESGVFGKPVFRKTGGRTADDMAAMLAGLHYLPLDEQGHHSLRDLEDAIGAELAGDPQYSWWRDPSQRPVEPMADHVLFGKLDTADLRARYGNGEDTVWRKLSARRMTSEANGMDVDQVADKFGFDSGDALVQALAAAMPPREVVDARTDERMLTTFGDITSPEALARAADEAVHNQARARFIASELAALHAATTNRVDTGRKNSKGRPITVDAAVAAAKEYAQSIIARLRIRDLRPGQYASAEARNAKLAEAAFAKADIAEAAMHKRNQLVNHYTARAALDAENEVTAALRYLRRMDAGSKTVDRGYQEQIDGLLERFDLKPASLRAIDARKSFAVWYAEQQAQGLEPNVPAELLDMANRKSYKDMTVEELRGLVDTIKQLEHQGRLKNKLLKARDKRDFDAIATELADSIVEHGGKVRAVQLEGEKGAKFWLESFMAMHRKLSSLFRQMDGGNDDGPMYRLLGRSMNEQGDTEDVALEQATVALDALYAPLRKLPGGITGGRSKKEIKEIGASLTRGGRLAVALNWGNEDNRQRLLSEWTEPQVRAVLATLTAEELAFVNGVWSYLDSYWPQIADKEYRLTGVVPEKVEAQPFVLKSADGIEVPMRGGYYPLKYDSDRSDRADKQDATQAAKEMMQGAIARATTRRGHTKERVKEVKRPIRKDLNVITQHITQVIHDLSWHEWLIDANKLLDDDRVVDAIRDHYGPSVMRTIRDGLMGIAAGNTDRQTALDRGLLLLRSNVSRATMGLSVTTALMQPFGLTQSIARIGGRHVLAGAVRWAGDAVQMESTVAWIHERSEFMRLRGKTFNKELREIAGAVDGKSTAMRAVDAGLFWFMQKMQAVADVPTWVGQYEKSIAEGLDDDSAIAMADRAVLEAQGGGHTKDLSEIQRKHPMLTQFYSYFSVTLNLTAEATARTDFRNPRAVAGWLGDMALLLAIPAIGPAMLLFALKGGGGDDDESAWLKRIAKWQAGYLLGMVVGLRELSGAVDGFAYAGPPVGRVVSDIGKAGTQTAQGEIDEPAVMAYANLLGSVFGLPMVQVIRSYKGWKAWDEGNAGPQAILLGPPPRD